MDGKCSSFYTGVSHPLLNGNTRICTPIRFLHKLVFYSFYAYYFENFKLHYIECIYRQQSNVKSIKKEIIYGRRFYD